MPYVELKNQGGNVQLRVTITPNLCLWQYFYNGQLITSSAGVPTSPSVQIIKDLGDPETNTSANILFVLETFKTAPNEQPYTILLEWLQAGVIIKTLSLTQAGPVPPGARPVPVGGSSIIPIQVVYDHY